MNKHYKYLVVGLGKTGLSCVEYLFRKGEVFAVADTRENPPNSDIMKKNYPEIKAYLGNISDDLIYESDIIVLSPGISFNEPFVKKAIELQKSIIGDVELFLQAAKAPVIAITGTNGKTTVTTLIGEMAKYSGLKTIVGGNIGTPVLDLLREPTPDVYVLELSSFQLQTTHSMRFDVSVLLNIAEDHIDHHGSMKAYTESKFRIFNNCKSAVINKTIEHNITAKKIYEFSLDQPFSEKQFGITKIGNKSFLSNDHENIMPVSELQIAGTHNQENALAAYAAGKAFGLDKNAMIKVLQEFKGVKHRCQLVLQKNNIKWYNDSKATNVSATVAAVQGLGSNKKNIILLLGGIGKAADFKPLKEVLIKYVKTVILYGRDAEIINKDLENCVDIIFAQDFNNVIEKAEKKAESGDIVLLAPACASFDMFSNYEHRGDEFERIVKKIDLY